MVPPKLRGPQVSLQTGSGGMFGITQVFDSEMHVLLLFHILESCYKDVSFHGICFAFPENL
jgi:hypothetical protein